MIINYTESDKRYFAISEHEIKAALTIPKRVKLIRAVRQTPAHILEFIGWAFFLYVFAFVILGFLSMLFDLLVIPLTPFDMNEEYYNYLFNSIYMLSAIFALPLSSIHLVYNILSSEEYNRLPIADDKYINKNKHIFEGNHCSVHSDCWITLRWAVSKEANRQGLSEEDIVKSFYHLLEVDTVNMELKHYVDLYVMQALAENYSRSELSELAHAVADEVMPILASHLKKEEFIRKENTKSANLASEMDRVRRRSQIESFKKTINPYRQANPLDECSPATPPVTSQMKFYGEEYVDDEEEEL